MHEKIFIITGPSGAGKSSVSRKVLEREPRLKRLVTHTTRPPRPNEKDGIDYFFDSKEKFEEMKKNNELFEYDCHYDYCYGSRQQDLDDLLQNGLPVLIVVDPNGARTISNKLKDVCVIFIDVENDEDLLLRINKRDKGDTKGLSDRLQSIAEERKIAKISEKVVINKTGKIDETVSEIISLIDNLIKT
ncbi:MAG: hypothetical protein ABIH21_02815 [Patescibacteria group bacterium]